MNPSIHEDNKSVYLRSDVVNWYGSDDLELQNAEILIFKKFIDHFGVWNVVDMGVGAGRTSSFLLDKCHSYLGVDYSEQMIKKCQNRFKKYSADRFRCADARNLDFIKDNSIDFFLFSFNGIDTVGLEDRKKILSEIYRVLKPNGYFAFSSHNLNCDLRKKHQLKFSFHPLHLWRSLRRNFQFNWHNPSYEKAKKLPQTTLRDGSESFLLNLAYQHPSAQIQELNKAGFISTWVFSNYYNREVSIAEANTLTEPWVYYLAQKNE